MFATGKDKEYLLLGVLVTRTPSCGPQYHSPHERRGAPWRCSNCWRHSSHPSPPSRSSSVYVGKGGALRGLAEGRELVFNGVQAIHDAYKARPSGEPHTLYCAVRPLSGDPLMVAADGHNFSGGGDDEHPLPLRPASRRARGMSCRKPHWSWGALRWRPALEPFAPGQRRNGRGRAGRALEQHNAQER